MERETHNIDVENRAVGRVASEIATLLRGKHKASFNPRKDCGDFVEVENVDKLNFSGKKLEQKTYYSHSGYPGGLKEKPVKELFEKDPQEVLKRAVWGMLPDNKLSKKQIKRLKFKGK